MAGKRLYICTYLYRNMYGDKMKERERERRWEEETKKEKKNVGSKKPKN